MNEGEVTKNRKKLVGIEKAAAMLLALPEDTVKKIFALLHDDETQDLARTMMFLGTITPDVIDDMIADFIKELASSGVLVGTISSTKGLLSKILTEEKMAEVLEEAQGPGGRTLWEKLCNINEDYLASYLKNEHPQTACVILTKIDPLVASRIIRLFPEEFSVDVMMRMLKMERIRKDVMEEVERTLRRDFISNPEMITKRNPYEMVANIINNFDRSSEVKLLGALATKDPESVTYIKKLIFGFEDLADLEDNCIQILIRNLDKNKLALALKGSGEDVKGAFLRNMSERVGRLMLDDMKSMGTVRLKDVEEAQSYTANTAKSLAASGAIFLDRKKTGQEEFVG